MQELLGSEFAPFAVVNVDTLRIHLTTSNKHMRIGCTGKTPKDLQYVWAYRLEDPTFFRGRDLAGVHICPECKAMRDRPEGLQLEME